MKKTNTLPFISWLLIASLLIAPIIVAFDGFDGGAFGGFDSGGFDGGASGGFDAGGFDGGGFGGFDAGGFDGGASAGFDSGGFDGGANAGTDAGGFDGGAAGSGGSGIDNGPGSFDGFNPGGSGFPPGGFPPGGPGGFPPEADAVWDSLSDVTIYQGTPSGTTIQNDVTSKCHDPDTATLTFGIASSSTHYEMRYVGTDLRIFNLEPTFVGTETVTLTCNGVPGSFLLHIISQSRPSGSTDQNENDETVSVYIGAIRIPNAYDAEAGALVPVIISFKNNGDKKIENLKAGVAIPEIGVRGSVGPMEDLAIGKRISKTIFVELPQDVMPGTYDVRITMDSTEGSASIHRVVHRDIEVIS